MSNEIRTITTAGAGAFDVPLEGVDTVRDLLAAIRSRRPGDEHGVVTVRDAASSEERDRNEYFNPSARRPDGPPIPWADETLRRRVVGATASGAWSRVDYDVVVR